MSAERLAEVALLLPCAGCFGIRGGCRALWTRASLEAARTLLSDVSRSVEGKIATAGGRGECRRRDSSSAGTVDRTSARSESWRERRRLARAGTAWLPTKRGLSIPMRGFSRSWPVPRGGKPRGIPRRWRATSLARISFHRCLPGPIPGR